jgi:ATP-dependent DNA ligase
MSLPFGPPLEPMLAKLSRTIPKGDGWQYEPKWDGFRCIVYFDGQEAYLQSRDKKPLARYFPELRERLEQVLTRPVVLDGEIVIMGPNGIDFDAMLMRIHPAESRVRMLAGKTPSSFVAFDLLGVESQDLREAHFEQRRAALDRVIGAGEAPLYVTPMTRDPKVAEEWFNRFEGAGFDGIIARPLKGAYAPGQRTLAKIKHLRTADCAVGGFRWLKDHEGTAIGSLLLGVYDGAGTFHHIGHTSSFDAQQRRELVPLLAPHVTDDDIGFGKGRTPGTPTRWTQGKDASWVRMRPELVCEVNFDHLQSGRFRHAARFLRWRPDKPAGDCTYDQLDTAVPAELMRIFESRS